MAANSKPPNKLPTWIWAVVLLAGWWMFRERSFGQEREALLDALKTQQQLNDSTAAVAASLRADKTALAGSLEAAEQLNGKLVAGMRLRVARRDTVIIRDSLDTTLLTDSTRVATFRDSTFAGVVEGTVVAPPCCAALRMDSLRVTRPEFSPEIGFVEVDGRHVATVTWQGEQVQVEAPFLKPTPPVKKREKPWHPFAEVGIGGQGILVKTGVKMQFFGSYSVVSSIERAGTEARWGVSLRRDFK